MQMQEKLAQGARSEPCAMTCAYGLCELAVPVKLGSETIGLLQTGQVMRQKPSEAAFDRAVTKGNELGVDLSGAKARAAFFQTPVASPKKIEAATKMLAIFADHLSMKSNQIAVQQASTEPPVITMRSGSICSNFGPSLRSHAKASSKSEMMAGSFTSGARR